MKNLICFLFLFLMILKVHSQSLISSGGSFHQGSGFVLHWSLGEFIVDTHIDNVFTLSKGFHQGDLKINTSVYDNQTLNIVLFPNPSDDFIEISGMENITSEGNILDNTGRVVRTFKAKESNIDISDLTSGLYHIVFKNTTFVLPPAKFIKI